MAARDNSLKVEGRLSTLEASLRGFIDTVRDALADNKADLKTIMSQQNAMSQTLNSTSSAVAEMKLEKCGARLDGHDQELAELKIQCVELDTMKKEVLFWRRVLGGGIHTVWKVAVFMLGSGTIGAVAVSFAARKLGLSP